MATSCIDLIVDDPPPLQWKATDWIGHGKTYPRDVPPHIAEACSVVLKITWHIEKWNLQRLDVRVPTIFCIFHARWQIRTEFWQMA